MTIVTDADSGRVTMLVNRGGASPEPLNLPGAGARQPDKMECGMTKTLATLAVAATLAAGAVALPKEANATCFGCYVGAGVLGGVLLGAAIASSPPPAYYAPAPVYAAPPPCYWQRQRVWNGYYWTWQPVRVCY